MPIAHRSTGETIGQLLRQFVSSSRGSPVISVRTCYSMLTSSVFMSPSACVAWVYPTHAPPSPSFPVSPFALPHDAPAVVSKLSGWPVSTIRLLRLPKAPLPLPSPSTLYDSSLNVYPRPVSPLAMVFFHLRHSYKGFNLSVLWRCNQP